MIIKGNYLINPPITETVTINGCDYDFDICWSCPDPATATPAKFGITNMRPRLAGGQGPGCNPNYIPSTIWSVIEAKISSWEFITEKCPNLGSTPPCGTGYITSEVHWPACMKFVKYSDRVVLEVCDDECDIQCIHTYTYCYNPLTDEITTVDMGSSISSTPPFGADCYNCELYTWETVVIPTVVGESSECFKRCD